MPPSNPDLQPQEPLTMDSLSPVKSTNPSEHSNDSLLTSATTPESESSSSSIDYGYEDAAPIQREPVRNRRGSLFGSSGGTTSHRRESRRGSLVGRVMGWDQQEKKEEENPYGYGDAAPTQREPTVRNRSGSLFGSGGPSPRRESRRGSLVGRVMGWDQQDEENTSPRKQASSMFRRSSLNMQGRSDSANSLRSYRDDENDEIWELLNQSKSRIEQQEGTNTFRQSKKADDDEVSLSTIASNATGVDDSVRSTVTTDTCGDEEDSIAKLLNKSKERLDSPTKERRVKKLPEKYNHVISDEKQSEKDALTEKELLVAIQAAEEAAQSGKESFETPAAEELRKAEEQKELLLAMEAAEEAAKSGIEAFKLIKRR